MYLGMPPVTPQLPPEAMGVMARESERVPQVIPFSSPQKITDNIKGKVCSLAVCAVAWLVAHVRMLGLDEREKSLQMIRQLAGPLYSENTLQFYNERSVTWPGPPGPCRCVVRSQHHQEQAALPVPGSRSPTTSSSVQALTAHLAVLPRPCPVRVAGFPYPLGLRLPFPTTPSHS